MSVIVDNDQELASSKNELIWHCKAIKGNDEKSQTSQNKLETDRGRGRVLFFFCIIRKLLPWQVGHYYYFKFVGAIGSQAQRGRGRGFRSNLIYPWPPPPPFPAPLDPGRLWLESALSKQTSRTEQIRMAYTSTVLDPTRHGMICIQLKCWGGGGLTIRPDHHSSYRST